MAHELNWTADPDSARRRIEQLEQLLACYQQAVGHKVRNQLISIGGLAQLLELELGPRLDTQARAYLERLSAVARETGDLLRTFAELGGLWRDPEPSVTVELAAAAREAATEVKVLYPQRRIEYHLREPLPAVSAPRRPLHRALVHLLRLAAELDGAGNHAPVAVSAETTPRGVALHVSNPGRCLSEDELTVLFQRLRSGAVAADQGLDLFFVRQAAALWGGGVSLHSEPGRGTTFTLLFAPSVTQ